MKNRREITARTAPADLIKEACNALSMPEMEAVISCGDNEALTVLKAHFSPQVADAMLLAIRRRLKPSMPPFKYQAVLDKVLLSPLPQVEQFGKVGELYVGKETALKLASTEYVELEILSAGPDCKSAKPGMKALITRALLASQFPEPIIAGGERFMFINEGALIAVCN